MHSLFDTNSAAQATALSLEREATATTFGKVVNGVRQISSQYLAVGREADGIRVLLSDVGASDDADAAARVGTERTPEPFGRLRVVHGLQREEGVE